MLYLYPPQLIAKFSVGALSTLSLALVPPNPFYVNSVLSLVVLIAVLETLQYLTAYVLVGLPSLSQSGVELATRLAWQGLSPPN